MRLAELITASQERLKTAGVDNPALDTRLLVAHALNCDRAGLLVQAERRLSPDEQATIDRLIARRAAREPVGRILGLREFWGLPFALNEATLEPRPDTETLVETSLHIFRELPEESLRLLDLGTGTGCILLALLHELQNATGLGVDLAPRAVEQARANAGRLGLEDRANFLVGDWLEVVSGHYDLIVSNPPYIPSEEIHALQPEVRLFDPHDALDGGKDGLRPYRYLIPRLTRFLKAGAWVVFEVGAGQAEDVGRLMTEAGFIDLFSRRDLAGVERCVAGRTKA